MRADAARIQNERIVHQVALSNQFAVRRGGMSVQETLVDRVVDDLDPLRRNCQQLFDFVLGELRYRNIARALRNTRRVK